MRCSQADFINRVEKGKLIYF